MDIRESRQIKLRMLIAFAVGVWIIVLTSYILAEYPDNWFAYASPPLFSILAFLYWRQWEPAALITVMLFAILVGAAQPEPFVTQYASLLVLFPPILALVLLTPRWVIISSITTILILLARANWQDVYTDPMFLAIYITMISGLLISRSVLDLKSKQLEALNRTLEQRISERTSDLERSLKFAQSVNEATPDIVYVYNLATNQTISSNRSILKILGYSSEQIHGMGHEFFPHTIHPDDIRTLPEQYGVLAQLADGAIYESEYRLRTAAGDWRWLASREVVFQRHPDGTPELVLGIATDITDRKASEDEIRHHSEELAQANHELARAARLKDEFLANMSHELRTPLTSILGRSELLQDELSGPLTEFQRRSVRGIEESGRHLLELINDILDLSKIEAGKMVLEIQPVALAVLIHACVRMIAQTAQRKQLRVHTILDPEVSIIDADPRRLKQILVNLLGNAVKFTPDGGEVGLEVRGDAAAQTVDLIVWDTGIGIDPADQQRLFQPFVQIDSGLTRQYEGTGLGLALVARLTAMHGGTVSLLSTLGQGSRFTVHLPWEPTSIPGLDPLPPPAPAPPLAISDTPTSSDPALILLVEDNPETLTLTTEYLTLHGYRVIQAQTGQAALVCAKAEQPALIIMDIQLPDTDGLMVTRALRADPSYAKIPILVLSAHALSGDNERSLAAGANAYMSKPVRLAELIATIAALLGPNQ